MNTHNEDVSFPIPLLVSLGTLDNALVPIDIFSYLLILLQYCLMNSHNQDVSFPIPPPVSLDTLDNASVPIHIFL